MSADAHIREGKEWEAKLLAEWDKRIKRLEGRTEDTTGHIQDKSIYQNKIAARDQQFERTFEASQGLASNLGLPQDSFERQRKDECLKLAHASTIYKQFSESHEKLNPLDKCDAGDRIRTTQSAAKAEYLGKESKKLAAMAPGEYQEMVEARDRETEEARGAAGYGPGSAAAADSSASIGADARMRAVAGTPTVRTGEALPKWRRSRRRLETLRQNLFRAGPRNRRKPSRLPPGP